MNAKKDSRQSYRNHRRIHPVYHLFFVPLSFAAWVAAIVHVFLQNGTFESWLLMSLSFMVCLGSFIFRRNAVVVQDRAIHTAEQLRHYMLTGRPLDPRLTLNQIIALRFASDEQFPSLASEAADKKLNSLQIKQAVEDWRPDTHRV